VNEIVFKLVSVVLGLGMFLFPSRADTHIYAGAVGTNHNDQLFFSNGRLFDATLSEHSFPQILRTNGPNAGYYRGDVLTFSAIPATQANGGPVPTSAALGARLAVQLVSVSGPPGGSIAFWEGDGEDAVGIVTFSVPAGTTNGTNYFVISQNSGEPGTDPYGHIHGRTFTSSVPGTYIAGFRIVDLSTHGIDGGPVHAPSDVLAVRFQAGLRIESIQTLTNRVTVSFRSPPGISNLLEVTESIFLVDWRPAAAPVRGNNQLQFISETNGPTAGRFYRMRQLNNFP